MAETRIERDTMEEMAVTSDRCWGAQTQISLNKTLACSPMNIAHDVDGLTEHCIAGIESNVARIDEQMKKSLRLVTAAQPAHWLRQRRKDRQKARAEVSLVLVKAEDCDKRIKAEEMIIPGRRSS